MSRYWDEKENDLAFWPVIRDAILALIILIAAGMYGCPQYHVWSQGLVGQAELRRAEQNRQIKIQEATAHQESAKHLAQAEIERAKGVAEANKIIGASLTNNEAYLRYLWIHALENGKSDVIYVPTEANLPILEAGRFGVRQPKQ
jgi:hypothetical protein